MDQAGAKAMKQRQAEKGENSVTEQQ